MTMMMPPEWAPQDWIWIGFPHDPVEWPGLLERAQEQIAAFANAVAESGQEVRLLVRDAGRVRRGRALQPDNRAVHARPPQVGDFRIGQLAVIVVEVNNQAHCSPLGCPYRAFHCRALALM